MSGHSKWSTIKRKKGAKDAAKGKIFTKIIKEIQVAAKMGGGDEDANARLKQAILAAKDANMPKKNIEKAIQKGTGELEGVNYEEFTYEGYGPGGVAILINTMTDNKNRTVSEVRHLLDKHGGNLGTSGSVAWMFETKGKIVVPADKISEEDIFMAATEAGAEDVSIEDDVHVIYTEPGNMMSVRKALENQGIEVQESKIDQIPKNEVKIDDLDMAKKLLKMIDMLEDNDDVSEVFANFDISEELIEQLEE
ncbi:MAG: YebC/PmpR family DNA-binding transcriptional regulator [Candidatus Marinimicrobia bacterium]|nr:YebC/PmpR family DNA-binding transcriptional regulator [Candidatus Neomarinimicrobiota bacterium]